MNETTETTTKGTVVAKPIPAIGFDDATMVALLMPINSATFVQMSSVTQIAGSIKKTGNRFYDAEKKMWNVEKCSYLNGIFASDYEKGVRKASDDSSFEAKPHKWAEHFNGSKVVMVKRSEVDNPTRFYAAWRPLRADEVSYRWIDGKEALTDTEQEELLSFKTKKPSTPIVWRTVAIDSIVELKMDKIRYVRVK